MANPISISNGLLRLSIAPNTGGGLTCFDADVGRGWVNVFRAVRDRPSDPEHLAFIPLIPWSNRIEPNFKWQDRQFNVPRNREGETYPLHGSGWTSAWDVLERSDSTVLLGLKSGPEMPFQFRSTLRYSIAASELSIEIELINTGDQCMPFGVGFHPWLRRSKDTQIKARARTLWIEDPRTHLPVNAVPTTGLGSKFGNVLAPIPTGYVNENYAGWDQEAEIAWPSDGLSLKVLSNAVLSHFVFYSPATEAEFFCFEPVSHLTNAHTCKDPVLHGLRALEPGEGLKARTTFRVERTDQAGAHPKA